MSIYGYMDCHDCRQSVFLGKALHRDDHRPFCFHLGGTDDPPNWKREPLNQVVWKSLADHASHRIDVRLEHEMSDEMFGYQAIGGDSDTDISNERYLAGWSGLAVGEAATPPDPPPH